MRRLIRTSLYNHNISEYLFLTVIKIILNWKSVSMLRINARSNDDIQTLDTNNNSDGDTLTVIIIEIVS